MIKRIAVLPGDGIGPEVTNQSIKVLDAIAARFGHSFDYHFAVVGAIAIDQTGNPLPDTTIDTCLSSDAVLFGAIGDPKYDHNPSATVRPEQGLLKLRKVLELYTNIRPIDTYKVLHHLSPVKAKLLENVDFVIFRELTGGIYFGKKEKSVNGDFATDECTYSKYEIERITYLAFQYAQKRKNKLTLIDKANVLETSRLWRSVIQEIAVSYPTVAVDYMYVDNAAMQIILNPAQFDVVLTENMFGDIISDEASVLAGSLGLLPSASVGNKAALFEPIHGSYPQAAGKDIANPIGSILSAAMMLDHFGLTEESLAVRKAVEWTLMNGFVSKDIDPVNNYSTSAIGDLIADHIEQNNGLVVSANASLNKSTII